MSSNNRNQRGRNAQGGGSGQQQQRRRGRNPQQGGSSGQSRAQAPKGPMMTALGESTYEAVFDHGNEGYGIWFDGMVRDDPMYKQFWKGLGLRSIYVKLEEDRIVIVRDLDREIPIVASDSAADKNSQEDSEDDAFAAEVAKADEVTYTPEEAARLFATESAAQTSAAAEAPAEAAAETEATAEIAEPEAPAAGSESPDVEANADADADADGSDAEEAPKKPAVRRRVTTRRAPAKKKADAGDE